MPALVPGNYAIYNNVAGDQLAITFHAVGQPLTVEKLDFSDDQTWKIVDPGVHGLLAILPVKDTTVQACWDGDQSVTICPGLLHDWLIQEADNGYTILDGGSTAQWGVTTGLPGEKIAVQKLNGAAPTQKWVFELKATQ